ncbi:hypothetical protein [Roseovarius atlanticus]|uniref:hypothetical protein n=1 Tax=Roseovarius atlanticus TaxID=1641875 RepID=UPI001C95A520|nr:hypothetical protein [Roseovarius atlanticus]MBY5988504.1 hypothetical protein [Roseovarius atlanticus]MBY6123895.1 hypothetical protein [Roseovarius atlanticus]MBY6148390.1 hypothetical protein [Roseovarius atlanticus]
MSWTLIILVALVVAAIAAVAIVGQRKSPGQRGSEPRTGMHTLESDYQSGMGGGNVRRWEIPRDPQAYAKLFAPKDTRK